MAHAAVPTCHFPFHLVLTDYIESKSGSAELIQVLSRLGICSSPDTFQRHKTAVVIQRSNDGLQREVTTGAFSVTSIDNIDRAAPGKRITSESPMRGFHGTSVQHVTPRPSCLITSCERPAHPISSAPPSGMFSGSFAQCDLTGNPRTISEHSRTMEHHPPSTLILEQCSSQAGITTMATPDLDVYRIQHYQSNRIEHPPLTQEAILESESEQAAIQQMEEDIFRYMTARRSSNDTGHFPSLKDFLAKEHTQQVEEKSMVTTLGVLPDAPESQDALKAIVDNIYQLYGVGTSQNWHVIVGDQKIFAALHKLKRKYGGELDWLLPFPGDWHFMKNYQPILMKIYFHAGLKELASSAGYKGSNLANLESCNDF